MQLNEKVIYKHSGWLVPEKEIPNIPEEHINNFKTKPFEIYFSLKEGFESKDEFIKFCNNNKIDSSVFTIFDVNGQVYAVAIENVPKQIILSKDKCFTRNTKWSSGNWNDRFLDGYESKCTFKDLDISQFPQITSKGGNGWDKEIGEIVDSLFDISVLQKASKVSVSIAKILLYYILFDNSSDTDAMFQHFNI